MPSNKVIASILPFFLLGYACISLLVFLHFSYPIEKAQFICSMTFLFMCLLFEVLFPFRKDWQFWKDKQSKNDIILYIFNTIFLIKAVSIINLIKLKLHVSSVDIWPINLPFIVQLLIAFYIFDFFYYWFHRLSHTVKQLWIFHAVHHSGNKIHFLKGNRSNLFLDALPYLFLTVFPLAFLNPPKEIYITMGYILTIFSFLVHSNINMQFPKLWEFFFISPKLHYMHHDIKVENSIGYNFSTLTLFWDKIFGTFKDYDQPEKINVGIENDPVNQSIFWQIFYPFK